MCCSINVHPITAECVLPRDRAFRAGRQPDGSRLDAAKLAKIKEYLPNSSDDSVETAHLIANLLSIPTPDYHEPARTLHRSR